MSKYDDLHEKQCAKFLSDLVSNRSYAKYNPVLNRRETTEEIINRNMNMHLEKYPKLSSDIIKAYRSNHDLKIVPSMRSMQFAGEPIIRENLRGYNCAYLHASYTRAFAEAFYVQLCGAGVGYSVQNHHIQNLPKIKLSKDEVRFIIHDSIAGWSDALDALMKAYFYGSPKPIFDFSNIRLKDSPLSHGSGKAPGPEPLRTTLNSVEKVLKQAIGRKLRSIEVHDIFCFIGEAVLAGGIRRSSLISFFDKTDREMMECKQGEWWVKNPQRRMANNSVVFDRTSTTEDEFNDVFDACIKSNSGEPGFFFTNDIEVASNPCCLSGNTMLLTDRGFISIEELTRDDYENTRGYDKQPAWKFRKAINSEGKEVDFLKVWRTGVKQVIKLTFEDKTTLQCTEDHRLQASYGDEIVAIECLGIYVMKYNNEALKVIGIEILGLQDVYDFSLAGDNHWGIVENGVIVHNCEISLNSNQLCNLSSINMTGIQNDKDLNNRVYAASLLGTLQASYTDFSYVGDKWKITTENEALLGVSQTGIADNPSISAEKLQKAAQLVKEVNEKYAKKIGINVAARTTCIKPEGNTSCFLGSSSGIHARYDEYYLRRVRLNSSDNLCKYLQNEIPDLVEPDLFTASDVVITIPQKSPQGAILRPNESSIQLLDRVIHYHKNWIVPGHRTGVNTHNVSCTIEYLPEEVDGLRKKLWENRYSYNGISLLPKDTSSYKQAPFESCTKEVYEETVKKIKDIDFSKVLEFEDKTSLQSTVACGGGSCEFTGK